MTTYKCPVLWCKEEGKSFDFNALRRHISHHGITDPKQYFATIKFAVEFAKEFQAAETDDLPLC